MLASALHPGRLRVGFCMLTSLRDFSAPRCTPPLSFLSNSRSVWTDVPKDNFHDSFYDITVEEYAKQPLSKLTLHQMLEAGRDAWFDNSKVLENARFTWEELPKRLARRLLDLQLLPYIVVTNPHIGQVYRAYRHAFDTLRETNPPTNMTENEIFTALLRRLSDEHAPMLDALANGLREIKRKPLVGPHLHLDSFLEAMLRSRISRRVLAEQHININNGRAGYIGIVCTTLSLSDSVDLAAGRCKQVCIETFGSAPEVIVTGDLGLRVPYIPAHIDYMLYELLKNASRAVMERHSRKKVISGGVGGGLRFAARVPPIRVSICGGSDDVTLRISDQGGGIPANLVDKVWEFGWTDLDPVLPTSTDEPPREGLGLDTAVLGGAPAGALAGTSGAGKFRMAGLGFGLPLSRLYARYFGGNLRLVSMSGYGVDAFLYLKGLVAESRELMDNSNGDGNELTGLPRDDEGMGSLTVGAAGTKSMAKA